MPLTFSTLKPTDRAFFASNSEVIDLLESMTPVELALAVPYLKIWRVDPDTNRPTNPDPNDPERPKAPLSLKLMEPPRFGASADVRFRERPPVSLERFVAKTQTFRNVFLNRTFEISFTVHRPDVIFGERDEGADNWSDILLAGNMFVVEYGWASSGKHPLLNGEGYKSNKGSTAVSIPGRSKRIFQVIKYNFQITPDMQFKIVVFATDSGDLHLRSAPLASISLPKEDQRTEDAKKDGKNTVPKQLHPIDKDAADVYKDLQNRLNDIKRTRKLPKVGQMVRFEDVANKFFAPVLEESFKRLGYNNPKLWLGTFNKRAGKTVATYGAQDMSNGRSIGDFEMPIDWIQEEFARVIKNGTEISVTNFIITFCVMFGKQDIWDRTQSTKDTFGVDNYTIPDVRVKTITNGKDIDFYIVDIMNEVTQFEESDRLKGNEKLTPAALREKLKNKNVPQVQLLKSQSFIKDAEFSVVVDEQLKSILIKRFNEPSREESVNQPTVTRKKGSPPPEQLIYSSAIQGDLVMIGNFVFDTFAMIWLDFGVKTWDGTFYVMEHEDVIDRGGFTTRVNVRSTGEDPLNTQGRFSLIEKKHEEEAAAQSPPPGQNKAKSRGGRLKGSKQ